ncbi:hypothetical protein HK101_002700, partial [Irineochytrium annulatum]
MKVSESGVWLAGGLGAVTPNSDYFALPLRRSMPTPSTAKPVPSLPGAGAEVQQGQGADDRSDASRDLPALPDATIVINVEAPPVPSKTSTDSKHDPANVSTLLMVALTAPEDLTETRAAMTDEEVSELLEKEAFGDERELLDLGDDDIVTRHYRRCCVHFLYDEDAEVFDKIVAWKEENEERTFEEAMEKFDEEDHSDALVRIAYMNPTTHWDAILKYALSAKDERKTDELRARVQYERELLRHHLFLVRERGIDAELAKHGQDDLGAHYIKIMASFDTLSLEAERMKLRMEVS